MNLDWAKDDKFMSRITHLRALKIFQKMKTFIIIFIKCVYEDIIYKNTSW